MSVYFSFPRNASIAASSKMSVEFECLLATQFLSASCDGHCPHTTAFRLRRECNQTRLKRGKEQERDIICNIHDITCHLIRAGNERWQRHTVVRIQASIASLLSSLCLLFNIKTGKCGCDNFVTHSAYQLTSLLMEVLKNNSHSLWLFPM